MNRMPQRRSSAIQNEPRTDDSTPRVENGEPQTDRPGRIPFGWRLAIIVWVCGFVGLFAYELWGLFWKMIHG
jgi:hypothetical protein